MQQQRIGSDEQHGCGNNKQNWINNRHIAKPTDMWQQPTDIQQQPTDE
jgi:hypothetical protein